MDLTAKRCVPCEGGAAPLARAEVEGFMKEVQGWSTEDFKKISKEYVHADFKTALDFINKVGEIAESEGHHPDMFLHSYKKVRIDLSTHAIVGLSENDFILAAKIDRIM